MSILRMAVAHCARKAHTQAGYRLTAECELRKKLKRGPALPFQ